MASRKTPANYRPTRKPQPMSMSMAQAQYAYRVLMGTSIPEDSFNESLSKMYMKFGEARIREVLAGFNLEDYLAGKLDV